MAENAKQHFVPQFLLRNFAFDESKKSITLYLPKETKIIERASIRDQCQRHRFYGADDSVENELSNIEGAIARIFKKIENGLSARKLDTIFLSVAVMLQLFRTQAHISSIKDVQNKTAKLLLYGRVSEEFLRSVKISNTNEALVQLGHAMLSWPTIFDMEPFIIRVRTHSFR